MLPSGPASAAFVALTIVAALAVPVGVARAFLATGGDSSAARRGSLATTLVVNGWLVATAYLALSGFLLDFGARPPRLVYVVGPAIAGVVVLALSPLGRRLAEGLTLPMLIGYQAFRTLVEIILWRLHAEGVVPVQMTFEGRNLDIVAGLTAMPVAWLAASGRLPRWGAILWNVACLGLLLNIVTIAILSMPYPLRHFVEGPANEVVFRWPFVWLPGFLVPLALVGHLLALRKLATEGPA